MRIATATQVRELDRNAIQKRGIPGAALTEAAAKALTDAALKLAGGRSGEKTHRAVIFCGTGNNGGDGIAVARFLMEGGWQVRCVLVGNRKKCSIGAQEMEHRLVMAGGKLEDFTPDDPQFAAWCLTADVMVDAIFGMGLNAAPQGDALIAIHMMNTCSIPVLSVDIASGVEADTGLLLGAAVHADATVSFTLPKVGNYVGKGGLCCGALTVVPIGIPKELTQSVDCNTYTVEAEDFSLPRRPLDAHKGDFGKVYILGGSMGMSGAPVMAAQAAVCTGAGLVSLGVPFQVWSVAAAKLTEAMVQPLPAGKDGLLELGAAMTVLEKLPHFGVCLIGPGLGRSNAVYSVVRNVLLGTKLPVVLDADGINALEGHIDALDQRSGLATILTPHDTEFQRLGGDLSHGDRLRAAREFAIAHSCCLVLKGHRSITAFPDGTAYINTTGNPGMAKGGSGDVLAGILVSLLGQGMTPREAAPMAVYLHGLAGDLCAAEIGEYGMTPTDMIKKLPEVMQKFVK
ncbi:MAG: NAD(P)H-hydrate dehydratase [Pseudoflavonifractor sp.]